LSKSGTGKRTPKSSAKREPSTRPRVIRPPRPSSPAASTEIQGSPLVLPDVQSSSSPALTDFASELFSVGHQPQRMLTDSERALLARFEKNLVSLISHELKTPLMGVLNGLVLLEQQLGSLAETGSVLNGDAFSMIKRGAERLSQTLATLGDIAALESGGLRVRLEEIALARLGADLGGRAAFRNRISSSEDSRGVILADPGRIRSAFELCAGSFEERLGVSREKLQVSVEERADFSVLSISCILIPGTESALESWRTSWSAAKVAHQGGLLAPGSAFSGVLADEQDFLARPDGISLGAEWVISHAVLAAHGGGMEFVENSDELWIEFRFPRLDSEVARRALIESHLLRLGPGSDSPRAVVLGYQPDWSRQQWDDHLAKLLQREPGLFRSSQLVPVSERSGLLWLADGMKDLQLIRESAPEGLSVVFLPEDALNADSGLHLLFR